MPMSKLHNLIQANAKEIADTLTVASVFGASHSVLLNRVNTYVDILAGLFAIAAACVSIYIHCTSRKRRRTEDEEKKDPDS